jgi:hypothetical protein
VGQFIPQYRTDGQYDHTETWASVRKAQSTETPRATPKVVPSDHVGDPARKPPSEARASGAIQNSGRWSVRRAERCEESRQRMSGSGTFVWTGRALQAECDDLEMIGLALLYPALERSVCAPGHHGYPRTSDLILRKALKGR